MKLNENTTKEINEKQNTLTTTIKENIQILENNLYWKDNKRYSLRQKHSMLLGGLQGEIKYKGNLAIFMPFLMVAKDLHLGKQTSFGLGKIDVKI